MRTNRLVMSVLALFTAISGASCTSTQILTPSELNSRRDQYDGKEVRVRGWLQYQFEDIGLWDSKEARDEPASGTDWPQSCVSLSGKFWRNMRHYSGPAVVDGTFRKHIYPPNVISNGMCNDTGLEVSKIGETRL